MSLEEGIGISTAESVFYLKFNGDELFLTKEEINGKQFNKI